MKFYILDERKVWFQAALEAATRAGFDGQRILRGHEVKEPGIGFIRPHAVPRVLEENRDDYACMSAHATLIQDYAQLEVYEDKSAQFQRWGKWMPSTWRFTDKQQALQFVVQASYPLVSKADVGASSVNVRILRNKVEAQRHIVLLFGHGIPVLHCADNARSVQKGYALLQQFIPHDVTWRVNAIGNTRAVFRRFNYADKPVAQTGNVEPVMELNDEVESLLEFADQLFEHLGTHWCALDILRDGNSWRLLETSLAWPWPSPGACNSAPLFGSNRRWAEMFDVMFDEVRAGVWQTAAT